MRQCAIFFFILAGAFGASSINAQNLHWSATQGPYSTTVNSFSSGGSNTLYAGTNVGLYQSTNDGDLWSAVPAAPGIVNDIIANGSKIYFGGAGGFKISLDAGGTWAVRDSGLPLFAYIYALKNINGGLYACLGSDGLYRSSDEGNYWEHINSGGIENKSVSAMISTGTSLILAEGAGIIRSIDNGFSWTESVGDIANQAVHTFAIKGAIIFAGTDAGVYRSTDDGATWNRSSSGMRSSDAISSITVSDYSIFAGTSDFNVDFNSTSGIYRSTDNGASWQLANNGLSNLSVYSIYILGSRIFAGTSLGISYSDNNGDLWNIASSGLPKPPVLSLTSYNDRVFAGSKGSYVFSTDDKGDHWGISKKGFTRPNVNALLANGTALFAGTDAAPKEAKGGIHRSTDNGMTWKQLTNGVPIMTVSSLVLYNSRVVAGGDSGIFSSTDNGDTWKHSSSDFPTALYADDAGYYSATNKGGSKVWRFTGNAGWSPVYIGMLTSNIQAITKRGSYLYLGTDSGIYRSQNSGSGFKLMTGDSLNIQCLWSNDLIVVGGTKTGIYVSSDDGSSWLFQQSASAVSVNALYGALPNLYAGTSSGVIKASLIGFAVPPDPAKNSLSLQVTNPSNSHAIIRYSIKERDDASLILYDILGNECARLFQDKRDAGKYEMEWNTALLPSGKYILCLNAGGKQASVKVSVIH